MLTKEEIAARVTFWDTRAGRAWFFRCPGCEQLLALSEKQFNGKASVACFTKGCGTVNETINFEAALRV
jgi:hypothetical protein